MKAVTSTYKFSVRDKVFNTLGFFTLAIVLAAAVISYGILPLFSRWPEEIFSPVLSVLAVGTGLLLVWTGSREYFREKVEHLDIKLSKYLPYRVVRFLVLAIWKIFSFLVSIVLLVWTGKHLSDERSTSLDHPEHQQSGWDLHPKHYYDNEPPPPFS